MSDIAHVAYEIAIDQGSLGVSPYETACDGKIYLCAASCLLKAEFLVRALDSDADNLSNFNSSKGVVQKLVKFGYDRHFVQNVLDRNNLSAKAERLNVFEDALNTLPEFGTFRSA